MSETEKLCKHELWELDTAIQDGHCPLCMQSRLAKLSEANSHLSAVNEKLAKAFQILRHVRECEPDRFDVDELNFIDELKLADEMGKKP